MKKLLILDLGSCTFDILDSGEKRANAIGREGKGESAEVVKLPISHDYIGQPRELHHIVHGQVRECYDNRSIILVLNDLSCVESLACSCAIGHDESGGAEFDASEIAHDHHHDVGQPQGIDLSQNRLTGGAGGLAIV